MAERVNIYKIAGLSLLGFCAVSIGLNRADIGPMASQLASLCGAFAGALVGQVRRRSIHAVHQDEEVKEAIGNRNPTR